MKIHIRQLLALIIPLISFGLSGQTPTIPPAPNPYQMTRFEATQPDLYTGTAKVDIPLYTIDFDGWDLPLSLSYHATGIRVNQEATEVGLGWTLNATGVISRTVNRGDDLQDDTNRKGYAYDLNTTNEIYDIMLDDTHQSHSNINQAMREGRVDTDPDIYHYNLFGYSGSFVFKKRESVNDIPQVEKLKEDGCRIIYNEQDTTFRLITPTGFIGDFKAKERSTTTSSIDKMTVLESFSFTWNNATKYQSYEGLRNSMAFRRVTSWYLTQITSPRGKVIEFNYDTEIDGSSKYVSLSQPSWGDYKNDTWSSSRTIHEHIYLDNIQINNELTIFFFMENRQDLETNSWFYLQIPYNDGGFNQPFKTPKRYTGITVLNGEATPTPIRNISLTQTYFNDKCLISPDPLQTRGRLDQVVINDQKYSFQYYTRPDGFPSKASVFQDHFGFASGPNNAILPLSRPSLANWIADGTKSRIKNIAHYFDPSRVPDFNHAVNGLLKKVIYPTGGRSDYIYELDQYDVQGINGTSNMDQAINSAGDAGTVTGGGIRISQIVNYNITGEKATEKNYTYEGGVLLSPLMSIVPVDLGYEEEDRYASRIVDFPMPYSNQSGVGYSRVKEHVLNINSGQSFQNIFEFENEGPVFDTDRIDGEEFANSPFEEFSYKNSSITGSFSLDENSHIKMATINNHQLVESNKDFKGIKYMVLEGSSQPLVFYKYDIPASDYNLYQSESITIEGDITDIQDIATVPHVSNTTTYTYNSINQVKQQETTNSQGDVVVVKTFRAIDYPEQDSNSVIGKMVEVDNLLSPVIETTKSVNGAVQEATANLYFKNNNHGDRIDLEKVLTYNPDNGTHNTSTTGSDFDPLIFEEDLTINEYNDAGQVLEYLGRDGTKHAYIWESIYPTVHGTNISYNDLKTAYDASQGASYEADIRSHTLTQNALIETYAYKPLVGIIKMTDPSGNVQAFEYDNNNRLYRVLDNQGYVVSEHEYTFQSIAGRAQLTTTSNSIDLGPVRDLDFTTDFYNCFSNEGSINITNTGDDNLRITDVTTTGPFQPLCTAIEIPPGSSYSLGVAMTEPTVRGQYDGSVTVNVQYLPYPSSEDEQFTYPITAFYETVTDSLCNISYPAVFDFGETLGSLVQKSIEIQNNSVTSISITDVSIDNTTDYYISTASSYCVQPGAEFIINAYFTPQGGIGEYPTTLNVQMNGCDDFQISVDAAKVTTFSKIVELSQSSLSFYDFTADYLEQTITLTNTGFGTLSVDDLVDDGPFTVQSSKDFDLSSGESQDITIRFEPAGFIEETGRAIQIVSNKTGGPGIISVSGMRTRQATFDMSPASLVFTQTFSDQNITITNDATSNTHLTGSINYSGGHQTNHWSIRSGGVEQPTGSTFSVAIGATKTFNVMQTDAEDAQDFSIDFDTDATLNPDRSVPVTAYELVRIMNLSSTNIDLGNFTEASKSTTVTVSNSSASNADLVVNNISSTNSNYSVSPTSFTIAPGSSQIIDITLSPGTSFTPQSTTLTIDSDKTNGGNTIDVTGKRDRQVHYNLTPPSLVFSQTFSDQYITISNDAGSNMPLTGSINYSGGHQTNHWSIKSGGVEQSSGSTFSVAPGGSKTYSVMQTDAQNANDFSIDFDTDATLNPDRSVSVTSYELRRILNLSVTNFDLGTFTGASKSTTITVSNDATSTADLAVSSISSTNNKYTVSPSSFTLVPGASQIITITLSPGTAFTQQSTSITINSDKTSGANTISGTGKRDRLVTYTMSPTSLEFTSSNVNKSISFTNSASSNSNLNVDITGYNNQHWSVSDTDFSLAAGASKTVNIQRTSTAASDFNLSVDTDATSNADRNVTINSIHREISVPSSKTFASFTGSTRTEQLTVSNNGPDVLTVTSVSSTNNKFSVSPTTFTVSGNGSTSVDVTYTPTDFSTQNTTLTFDSNSTTGLGNESSVQAKRDQLNSFYLSPSSKNFTLSDRDETVYIINNGNTTISVNSITLNNDNSSFTLTSMPSLSETLSPGSSTSFQVNYVNNATSDGSVVVNTSIGSQTLTINGSTF